MSSARRLAAFLALATLVCAVPARADDLHFARRLLKGGDTAGGGGGTGSGTAAAPPSDGTAAAPSLDDITGPPTEVSLPDLLAQALKQAPDLQSAVIDLEIADAQIEAARSIDDTSVNASLGGTSSVDHYTADASVDFSRVLSGGTVVGLSAHSGFDRGQHFDMSTLSLVTSNAFDDEVTASVTQPLLEGRGKSIVQAQKARAAIARTSAELQRRSSAIQVIRDVVNAYWELVFAQRDLEIRQSSLDLANERLRRTLAGIKGGGLARTEALEVQQVVATRQEEVLQAELTLVDRSIDLRRAVGMEIGPRELTLTTATDLGVPGQSWDLDALVADAYETSPELALLTEQGKDASIEVEVTENGVLPSLDLSLSAGPVGADDGFGGAAKNMVTFDDYSAAVTLTYQHSIGNHAATGAAREARAQRRRIQIDEFDTKAQIAQSLTEAVLLADSASKRVELAGTAIDLAQQNIVAEQSRYSLGKSTNFDVLQRQDELKQAQLRQARAIIDWHEAATAIAAIDGTLLDDYGIKLEK
jgi:outer membrane protein